VTSRVTNATWHESCEPRAHEPWVSGTERLNEALHHFAHVTRVTGGCGSGWLPRHEPGLLVGFDVRAAVSYSAGQLEIGRTAALGPLIRQARVRVANAPQAECRLRGRVKLPAGHRHARPPRPLAPQRRESQTHRQEQPTPADFDDCSQVQSCDSDPTVASSRPPFQSPRSGLSQIEKRQAFASQSGDPCDATEVWRCQKPKGARRLSAVA
jgi:hypothetical protein